MTKSACQIINFQDKRRKNSFGRRKRDKAISASPITTQMLDAISEISPRGLIFVALTEDGVSYGVYGTATESTSTAAKALLKVVADIV